MALHLSFLSDSSENLPLHFLLKQSPWHSHLKSMWLQEDVYLYMKYQPPGTHLKGSHVFRAGISSVLL